MSDARIQHAREIAETKACWEQKPLLQAAYRNFHREIRQRLTEGPGLTVELGSGIGVIKETIPDCVTTDAFANTLVDQEEDAYRLSFADDSVSNLILFDVWHHLEYPGTAMAEFSRVLKPSGRLILFEPAALSWLGRLVFGHFHHEPIHAPGELSWYLPEGQAIEELPYYAAQGNAWKMFRAGQVPDTFHSEWKLLEIDYFPAFDWLAAGGFRQRQMCPSFFGPFLKQLSRLAAVCPPLFATRMLISLERIGN